ncbi:hypothetical protein HNR12_002800 [Streptomonospora nanhaiensis]|uniref:Uncharacterized protein n=1 Tax=Streptomonospora nanhaiensis TaxID=1323731 RepID=A0A853BMT5_9ACTN|nr:hypothetical protein [Streptomonospora nanhaiensis]
MGGLLLGPGHRRAPPAHRPPAQRGGRRDLGGRRDGVLVQAGLPRCRGRGLGRPALRQCPRRRGPRRTGPAPRAPARGVVPHRQVRVRPGVRRRTAARREALRGLCGRTRRCRARDRLGRLRAPQRPGAVGRRHAGGLRQRRHRRRLGRRAPHRRRLPRAAGGRPRRRVRRAGPVQPGPPIPRTPAVPRGPRRQPAEPGGGRRRRPDRRAAALPGGCRRGIRPALDLVVAPPGVVRARRADRGGGVHRRLRPARLPLRHHPARRAARPGAHPARHGAGRGRPPRRQRRVPVAGHVQRGGVPLHRRRGLPLRTGQAAAAGGGRRPSSAPVGRRGRARRRPALGRGGHPDLPAAPGRVPPAAGRARRAGLQHPQRPALGGLPDGGQGGGGAGAARLRRFGRVRPRLADEHLRQGGHHRGGPLGGRRRRRRGPG